MPTICGYIVVAQHPNRKPYTIGTFDVPRETTEQATEAAAAREAQDAVRAYYADHYPAGQPLPSIVYVKLGHMTFVPDDHSWGRA